MVLRGESRRGAELSDLSYMKMPDQEGATPCEVMLLQVSNGKTNKFGKKQYGGTMRHKDPLFCTQSALAQYFFFRWHQTREPPPDFTSRSSWYNTKVLVGGDPQKPLAFRTQFDDTDSIFKECGVVSDSKTHAPRKGGVQSAEFHGCSESQARIPLSFLYYYY